jgi:hypothetical protein
MGVDRTLESVWSSSGTEQAVKQFSPERRKLTPPQVAARYGISPDKVLAWIRQGDLSAFNAATKADRRPRWLIDEDDLAAFEARRASPTAPERSSRSEQKCRPSYKRFI